MSGQTRNYTNLYRPGLLSKQGLIDMVKGQANSGLYFSTLRVQAFALVIA